MQRPISPHLQIYKLPLAVMMSIAHRITGAYFYFTLIAVVWLYYLSVFAPTSFLFEFSSKFFDSYLGKFTVLSFVFAFFFHTFSGIRHLIWDTGRGFSLITVRKGNIIVITLSLVFTFAAALFIKLVKLI